MVATSRRVGELDCAALDALRQWRFAPTEQEGAAVRVRVRVRVVIEMRGRLIPAYEMRQVHPLQPTGG